MSRVAPEADLDQLGVALARLLAEWWHRHTEQEGATRVEEPALEPGHVGAALVSDRPRASGPRPTDSRAVAGDTTASGEEVRDDGAQLPC